jgi:hypothetical protein
MDDVASRILSATKRGWFREEKVYAQHAAVTEPTLLELEAQIGTRLPEGFRRWLLMAGFGDIGEELALRSVWLRSIDRGELRSHLQFGQDILGNFYSCALDDTSIHFISRRSPEYALLAPSFTGFLEGLVERNFKLRAWTDTLQLKPYAWDA